MYRKQQFSYPNEIFLEEEHELLALRQKALKSTSNSQILGKNGEVGIKNFLNRYLPSCFKAVSGHFTTSDGTLSPEIDIIIVDSRFPYVSQNADGSAIVMLDSVLASIEVKLTLGKREIFDIRSNSVKLVELSKKHIHKKTKYGTEFAQYSIGYHSDIRFETLTNHFFDNYKSKKDPATDLYVLRLPEKDQIYKDKGEIGAMLWLESFVDPSRITTLAPLSDFYYRLVQNAYFTISERDIGFVELGNLMGEYMTWGTFPSAKRKS